MAAPQEGIVHPPASRANSRTVVLKVRPKAGNPKKVARLAGRIPALAARIGKIDPKARLTATVAFGTGFWNSISKRGKPRRLRNFPRTEGPGKLLAPSTGGDVMVHIISRRPDLNFELANTIRSEMGEAVRVLDDVAGFEYLDSRDMTGHIDGTENPSTAGERREVALIGDEDPAFSGGSYVFHQRFVHDLARWNRLSDKSQERAVGRTKKKSVELSEKKMPGNSHVSRVVMEDASGEEMEIVRASFPYGGVDEKGLVFVAFTRDLRIPLQMLKRMMGVSGDGRHDRLMDFTQAVTGATFFAPSLPMLKSLAR